MIKLPDIIGMTFEDWLELKTKRELIDLINEEANWSLSNGQGEGLIFSKYEEEKCEAHSKLEEEIYAGRI